jgi:hypothetical protein
MYKIGLTWNANFYIRLRGGNDPPIDLSFTVNETKKSFIFDPVNEFMCNCIKLQDDISKNKIDEE